MISGIADELMAAENSGRNMRELTEIFPVPRLTYVAGFSQTEDILSHFD